MELKLKHKAVILLRKNRKSSGTRGRQSSQTGQKHKPGKEKLLNLTLTQFEIFDRQTQRLRKYLQTICPKKDQTIQNLKRMLNLNIKKKKSLSRNPAKTETVASLRRQQIKHTKRCLTSSVISKMQIKAIMRQVSAHTIQKNIVTPPNTSKGEEYSYTAGSYIKWYSHSGKQFDGFFKK